METSIGTRNITQKITQYFRTNFRFDLTAGIIVGLIALPLAIAFAVASGARAEQGIYTSIIAGIVIGLLSGSRFQISGPTGAFVVILLNIVNNHGLDGLLIAGCMAGIVLVAMGLFKFGSIIKFIPYPVTVGFTSGIAVIIFSSEIKDFFGLHFEHRPHDFVETIAMLVRHFQDGINLSSVIIGMVTLGTFLVWQRTIKKFPAAPGALLAGILTSVVINVFLKGVLPSAGLVGTIPIGFPAPHLLAFNWDLVKSLIPSALTIAMLGAIESLLSAVVADGMTDTKHDSNRELIAQGIGNIILPFFGGIPATGAIARTAANIRNGAKTRVASIIHGLVLLLVLLFAAPLAQYIPLAALAAILMMVAYNMSEIPHFLHLLDSPKQDAAVLVVTFLLTVFTDLTTAVGIGVVLAAILFIQRASKLTMFETLEDIEGAESETLKQIKQSLEGYPEIAIYKIAGPLFFGVAAEFENRIQHQPNEVLIMRMKYVTHMDATGIHALEIIIERVKQHGGKIYFSMLQPRLYRKLSKLGIIDMIGGDQYVAPSVDDAITAAKHEIDERRKLAAA
jgi:SulP family sulfate permease